MREQRTSGCINWPNHKPSNSHNGMFVYFVVPAIPVGETTSYEEKDPFVNCLNVGFSFHMAETLTEERDDAYDWDEKNDRQYFFVQREWFPHVDGTDDALRFLSKELLACVALGSSNVVWDSLDGDTVWRPTLEELNQEGRALVAALEKMHDRKGHFLVFIDT